MNKTLFALLVLTTTALMGSSFAIGKIGLKYNSPLLLVGIRFTLAGLMMAFFVILLKRSHPNNLYDWLKLVIVGIFQTALVMGPIFLSLRTITARESSVLTFGYFLKYIFLFVFVRFFNAGTRPVEKQPH